MGGVRVNVILQPLGRTTAVLKSPLAKYNPQIIVIFSNEEMEDHVILAKEHINSTWSKYVHNPEIIEVMIRSPYSKDTIEDYMKEFDNIIMKIKNNQKGNDVKFFVGTTGGTNLMGIASALCSLAHGFPTYYTLPEAFYPNEKPEDLLMEIDLFQHYGPAISMLRKRPRHKKCLEIFAENGPQGCTAEYIKKEMDVIKETQFTTDLKKNGLIENISPGEWKITQLGRLSLHQG